MATAGMVGQDVLGGTVWPSSVKTSCPATRTSESRKQHQSNILGGTVWPSSVKTSCPATSTRSAHLRVPETAPIFL